MKEAEAIEICGKPFNLDFSQTAFNRLEIQDD